MRICPIAISFHLWVTAASAGAAQPAPGTLDPTYNPDILTDGSIVSLVVLTNGQCYVAGNFTRIQGVGRTNLARLNADGSVDASFAPDAVLETQRFFSGTADSSAKVVVAQMVALPEGGLLMSGWAVETNRPGAARLFKWDPDGRLDPSVAPRFDALENPFASRITALAIRTDGKIIVAGGFSSVNGVSRHHIVRLHANGTLDTAFDARLDWGLDDDAWLNSLGVQADGRIVVGGVNHPMTPLLFRLHPDGAPDASFNVMTAFDTPFPHGMIEVVRIQADQRILVGGSFDWRGGILRLNPDGSLDSDFRPISLLGEKCTALEIDRSGKNKFLAVSKLDYPERWTLSRFNADGSTDFTFDSHPIDGGSIAGIQVGPGGSVWVAGHFDVGSPPALLVQLNTEGALAAAPRVSAYLPGAVDSLAAAPGGKAYITGQFTQVNGVRRHRLARLNSDGTTDESFWDGYVDSLNPDSSYLFHSLLAVQPDGKLILYAAGVYSNVLVRLNMDGSRDTGFEPQLAQSFLERYAVVQSNGKIVCAGMQLLDTPYPDALIYRLNTDGTLDPEFAPLWRSPAPYVNGLAVQPDGKILYSTSNSGITRLNPDGSIDETFASPWGADHWIQAMVLDSSLRILVAHSSPSSPQGRVSRLHPDGSLDTTFEPDWGAAFSQPGVLALQPDGKILLEATMLGPSGYGSTILRLNADGSWDTGFATSNFDGYPTTIAVQPGGSILARGGFTAVNSVRRYTLARLHGGDLDLAKPVILSGPTNATLFAGATAELDVVAYGFPQISYQWRHDGTNLPGANRRVLRLADIGTHDAGWHTVVIANTLGSVTSSPALLQVIPTVPLAQAMDNAELSWFSTPRMNPTNSWVGILDVSHDGHDAARNQPLPDNGMALCWTEVAVPGTLSFWWKVSSESGYDFLRFGIGDTWVASVSGETGWQQITVTMEAHQQAQWIYIKDGSLSAGADCGWVDQVVFTPSPARPVQLRVGSGRASGRFPLNWTGESGRAYRVLASSNLVDWITLTNAICLNPEMEFVDQETPPPRRRFYGVVTP